MWLHTGRIHRSIRERQAATLIGSPSKRGEMPCMTVPQLSSTEYTPRRRASCVCKENQPDDRSMNNALQPGFVWACQLACLSHLSNPAIQGLWSNLRRSTVDQRFINHKKHTYTEMDIPAVRTAIPKDLVSLIIRSPSVSAGGAGNASDSSIFGTSPSSSRKALGSPAFRQNRWDNRTLEGSLPWEAAPNKEETHLSPSVSAKQ